MRLIDAADGRQVWAEAYTHPIEASRLIATQEQIAHERRRRHRQRVRDHRAAAVRRVAQEASRGARHLRGHAALLQPPDRADRRRRRGVLRRALWRAAEREPEYGPVWSALATLHCQMYTFDAPGVAKPLDTALEYARRGVISRAGLAARPDDPRLCQLSGGGLRELPQESEIALALNPNSPYAVGTIGYFHAMRGDFDRGLALLDRAIAVCPCHPRWFHSAYVLRRILEHDYEGALAETTKHLPFIGYWDDAVQAAMLGKLGRIDEARVMWSRWARSPTLLRAPATFGRAA